MNLFSPSRRLPGLAFTSLIIFALLAGLSIFSMGEAHARPLAVKKKSETGLSPRSTDADARQPIGAAPSYKPREFPLDLGRVKPVFERRQLERRTSMLRGSPDTTVVKIAMFRIEFGADRMADLTTGDGRMMRVNPDPDRQFIDPPPHNEAYFKAHLEAVNRYWSSMTYGGVRLEGDVFPRGEEFGAYTLSDMADYGPESENEFFSVEGLTRFFQDCLKAADTDSAVAWNDYDVYFIVHAGSDWQNDILGNSPFDLPTFSITVSDSDVVVTDTADTLTTGIVYPETSSQDGFLVALNGAIAHEMGHQLGLFDIYNVETFAPTVGFYDVMDSGNLASVIIPSPTTQEEREVIGVLPTCPGAWSRWLILFRLGIDPPLLKEDASRLRLTAIQSRTPQASLPAETHKWFRVPISDAEYFMVENRVDDLDGRDDGGGINTALDQDDSTGVVLGPINATTDEISHNYDLLLDPGVVIWHVDERQVLANFTAGRGINVFYDKRAVTIEEADGIIDIGSPFSEFPLGTDRETFHAANNANFTPTTRPNSDSNLDSPSNISIMNIGPRAETVTMDVTLSSKPRGWPMKIAPYGAAGLTSVIAADVNGTSENEIIAASDSTIVVFQFDDRSGDGNVDIVGNWPAPSGGARTLGQPRFTPAVGRFGSTSAIVAVTDSGAVYCWDSLGAPFGGSDSTGLVQNLGAAARTAGPAIPADLDGDRSDELYYATEDGFFHGWDVSPTALTRRFPARPLRTSPLDSGEVFLPSIAVGDLGGDGIPECVAAFVEEDSLHVHVFDQEGRRPLRRLLRLPSGHGISRVHLVLADLDRSLENNDLELVLATDTGTLYVLDNEANVLPGWPIQRESPIAGPPAIGDIDHDGLLEIVLASGGNRLDVLNYNATSVPGWPKLVPLADFPSPGLPSPGPAVADVDGDGSQDVVSGFADFTLRAFSGDGREIVGFPLLAGAAIRSTPCVLDANGDGRLEVFFQSTDGFVYARNLAGLASRENPAWPMLLGGPSLHGSYDPSRLPARAAEGHDLLRGPVTIFPNPAFSNHAEITVRYNLAPGLAAATGVDVSIYNMAGELVREVRGTTFANTENVAQIPVSSLASGAYFCTLRARSGDREESFLERFAVIR